MNSSRGSERRGRGFGIRGGLPSVSIRPQSSYQNRGFGRARSSSANNQPIFVPYQNADFAPTAAATTTTNRSSLPHIGFKMLDEALQKTDDELIMHIERDYFQLDKFLADERMKEKSDWLRMLTTIFERILGALGQDQRIASIFIKLPNTTYFDALYETLRKTDPKTNTLPSQLILQTLKILERLITISPQTEEVVTRFLERISGLFSRFPAEDETLKSIKDLHQIVTQKAERIFQQQQMKPETKASEIDNRKPPDDFRMLDIIPSMGDILSDEKIFLRKNLVDQGATYTDADHYLDVHFRLLREDFLQPLRDGIKNYLVKTNEKNNDVRIYENVFSLGPKINPKTGIIFGLQLDKTKFGRIQWKNSRRLIYGSLIALTSDCFQTCTIMTVEEREGLEKDLTLYVRPYIPTSDAQVDRNMTKYDQLLNARMFTMVETTSYFEAYRHILRALQKIPASQFPLAPYILKLSPEVKPPDYVDFFTTFDFTPLLVPPDCKVSTSTKMIQKLRGTRIATNEVELSVRYEGDFQHDHRYRSVRPLVQNTWPTAEELHLNPKQYEALVLALTKKVALIQGPPGTGKTFLGVKIAELLLHNRSVWCPSSEENSPILMVCQTNHALDQFLEHIIQRLNMKSGLIRVGGRCKNETISPFSIAKIRQQYRENRSFPNYIYNQKREIAQKRILSENKVLGTEKMVEISYQSLTSINILRNENAMDQRLYSSLMMFHPDRVQDSMEILNDWLGLKKTTRQDSFYDTDLAIDFVDQFSIQDEVVVSDDEDEEREEEERRRNDDDDDDEFIRPVSRRSQAATTVQSQNNQIDKDEKEDSDRWQIVSDKKTQKKLIYDLLHSPTTLNDQLIQNLMSRTNGNLWKLSIEDRHNLYRYWLEKYRKACQNSVENARTLFNEAVDQHHQYLQQEDYFILQKAIIVAMTTTGAAKHYDIIQKLGCKIVIVEEAAEIFEAHITTSLSPKCQHLILIGDHVQLRPNPSVYRLATQYNIDVSLFERLVKNQFQNVRLNIQHRMRPEICRLMIHFYDDLQNHRTVETDRPAIIGVQKNLFFVTHRHPEEQIADGNSKQNKFEAEFVVALAHFLIKQGYQPSSITILVMYLGQRALIARMIKQSTYGKTLQGLRVNVTDSYQGEENEIILLSLVRSENAAKSIGFLKIHNRICVALSRARRAMYIVGNLDFLKENEDMWKKISKTLKDLGAVGEGLPLCCAQHPDDPPLIARSAGDFKKRPEGGCEKLCGARLPCGHSCPKFCHNYSHDEVKCLKTCLQKLPLCEHQCKSRCHFDTPNNHSVCRELVKKTIAACNHEILLACHLEPRSELCTELVSVQLPCGHRTKVKCPIRRLGDFSGVKCQERCQTKLLCSHICSGTCSTCQAGQLHVSCGVKSTRQMLCSHSLETTCAETFSSCASPCENRCSHSQCKLKCGQPCTPCRERCQNSCPHEKCSKLCSEPCDRNRCNVPCLKKLSCGHPCIGLCGELCPTKCRICNRQLVEEFFFGNEDDPHARFVRLVDCEHFFEVTKLDEYVDDFFEQICRGQMPIGFPRCPRNECRKTILHCQRYRSLINQIQIWIENVRFQQQNQLDSREILSKRRTLLSRLIPIYRSFDFQIGRIDSIFSKVTENVHSANIDEVNFLENAETFLRSMLRIHEKSRQINVPQNGSSIQNLLIYIFGQFQKNQIQNFTSQQLFDIENEIERIRCLVNYHLVKNSSNESIEMKNLVEKLEAFSTKDQKRFKNAMEKLLQTQNISTKHLLLPEEKLQTVQTIQIETTNWFVCQHDQVYSMDRESGKIENNECALCDLKKRYYSK